MSSAFFSQVQRQSNDCSFHAGILCGAPIKISYFIVLLFAYDMIGAVKMHTGIYPVWYTVLSETLNEIVLFTTILCHEFGHGKMSIFLGGKIEQILLWPFGGICFHSMPGNVLNKRQKLVNELKVVAAGPMTHFLQLPLWLAIFMIVRNTVPNANVGSPSWQYVVPFYQPKDPQWCGAGAHQDERCIASLGYWLLFEISHYAVIINVMLFLFNVFFPMYPLDGSKIISCTLMLCGLSAITAARVLIFTSIPLAIYFIYWAFSSALVRGGVATGIMAYLGFMCLAETFRIYSLLNSGQIHRHPLFEIAETEDTPEDPARPENTDNRDNEAHNAANTPVTSKYGSTATNL
eukprot:GEMP01043950.1.p1 GENE.GEMP01043950.1~~GEMP01043950.1.p1  ORF type:complete len:348 (+),score=36.31 GEMP01043950.1:106-1149(+)